MSTTTEIVKADVSADAKHLAVFMEAVLAQVVSSYASYNMPLPDRQYYTMSDPAIDCEQVVVSFIQMYVGAPGDEATQPRRCDDPRTATLNVIVTRAIPIAQKNGNPPTAAQIQAASEIVAYDAYILLDSATQLDLWDNSGAGLGVIATVEARVADGGMQSSVLVLTVSIP